MKMLRTARKTKGLTMKELGEKVGVSESAISQYETGKREADFETLLKIGEVLDCSIDYLLRGKQEKIPTPEDRDALSGNEKSPGTTEAAPGDHVLGIFNHLNNGLISLGLIDQTGDITRQQADILISVAKIIHAAFDKD